MKRMKDLLKRVMHPNHVQNLSKCKTEIDGVKITIVDASGWNDSNGQSRDREHVNNLCAYLRGCRGISNFILVRNGTNCRFDDNLQGMLRKYREMFGGAFWDHLVVVMTFIDVGRPLQKYNKGKRGDEFRNDIVDAFGLNQGELEVPEIPVIPIGFDNYDGAIKRLLGCLSKRRFECQRIRTPLHELKNKQDSKSNT
eukprot:159670_1